MLTNLHMSEFSQNVGSYLIQRLYDNGVRHIFGVPGDFVLGFYQELVQSNKLKVINTCDEQGAGFAADAYARINGLGAVCVTYCVGGLKVVNTTAQAFAEKSHALFILIILITTCYKTELKLMNTNSFCTYPIFLTEVLENNLFSIKLKPFLQWF